jgi:hypothetical protein
MQRIKNKNKYIEKNCASCWSFTKNHYMMHVQQNIKYKTQQTEIVHWERKLKRFRPAGNHDKMKSRVVERKSETPWSRDKHDNMKLFIGKSK